MPNLVLDIPNDIYEALVERAAEDGRSLREEAIYLLRYALRGCDPNQAISAPFDLPYSSQPERVKCYDAKEPRLPDPID